MEKDKWQLFSHVQKEKSLKIDKKMNCTIATDLMHIIFYEI